MTEGHYYPQQQYHPPAYPPGYHQNQAHAPQRPSSGLGITSMILGIIAIVLAFIPVVGILSFGLGLAAVILGIFAIIQKRGKGQGIAGLITGVLSLGIAGIVTLLTGVFVSAVDEGLQEAADDLEEEEAEVEEAAAEDDEATEDDVDEVTEEDDEPADSNWEWVEVATLSGTGDERGEVFTIENDARITYEFTADTSLDDDLADLEDQFGEEFGEYGDSFAMAAVYLVPEGDSLAEDGGLPEMMIDGDDSGDTMLYQTGSYYLDVAAANYESWTVTIEEQQ